MSTSLVVLLYAPDLKSNRLAYVCAWLSDFWGIELRIETSAESFLGGDTVARMQYAQVPLTCKSVVLPVSGFLAEGALAKASDTNGEWLFPAANKECTFAFDPLAAIFWLLTRAEEYGNTDTDQHKRYKAVNSYAYKQHVLQKPLADIWAIELAEQLFAMFPKTVFNWPKPRFEPTFDIDIAFAYKGKSFLKHLNRWLLFAIRLRTWPNITKDPFDTFEYLLSLCEKHRFESVWFWLLSGTNPPLNPAIKWSHPALLKKMKFVQAQASMGVHPSYHASDNESVLKEECNRFAQLTGRPPTISRQHFIKMELPSTYKMLLEHGISDDYSMGYPDQIGFRAGTSRPFFWYDLELETVTPLRVHPFMAMDVTLKDYLRLSSTEAVQTVANLWQQVQAVHGNMTIIWHNTSFYAGEGWGTWEDTLSTIFDIVSSNKS